MKLDRWLLTGLVGTQIIIPSFAADDASTIDSLKRQIQDLDQKVRILERNKSWKRKPPRRSRRQRRP